jgi:hypothetical protein
MGNLAQSNNIVVVVYFGGLQVLRFEVQVDEIKAVSCKFPNLWPF